MIGLMVEYSDESQQLNSARFGNTLMESVSNAGEILLFKSKTAERKNDNIYMDAMNKLGEKSNMTMEVLVKEYFNSQTDLRRGLKNLGISGQGSGCQQALAGVLDSPLTGASGPANL